MSRKRSVSGISKVAVEDLSAYPRFAGLSHESLEWLSERFVREEFKRGEFVFRESEPTDSFRLIEKGSVKVFKTAESGREIVLHFFASGESLGEAMLFDQGEFPASAMALEPCRILKLSRENYLEMFNRDPKIAHTTIRSLLLRNMQLTRRIYELGSGGVEARLAQMLLGLIQAEVAGEDHDAWIPFALSRQELADSVGARVETVIRIVKRWEREGLLKTLKEGFRIDTEGLMRLIQEAGE